MTFGVTAPPTRPKCIKTDLQEIGLEDMNWIHLDQNNEKWPACVNMVLKHQSSRKVNVILFIL
jgi:hypothetical protein